MPNSSNHDISDSITLESLGNRAALSLGATLFTAPANFFLQQGLRELFGHPADGDFQAIRAALAQLQEQLQAGINRISAEIKEAALEPPHATIATYFTSLLVGLRDEHPDAEAAARAIYGRYFAANDLEIANELSRAVRILHDVLLGRGAHQSTSYLDVLATRLYNQRATLQEFERVLAAVGRFYMADLVHATLILAVLRVGNEDLQPLIDTFLVQIGEKGRAISARLDALLRDMITLSRQLGARRFHIINRATGKRLGRYVHPAPPPRGRRAYTSWDVVKPEGAPEGYVYLRAVGASRGIDHYYGRSIRSIRAPSSAHHHHIWRFVPSEEHRGFFRIQNRATGKILDHYYGRDIAAANLDEHPNHLWEVTPDLSGEHLQIVNKATGAVLGLLDDDVTAFRGHSSINAGVYNPALEFPGLWDALSWSWEQAPGARQDFFNLVNARLEQCVDFYYAKSFIFVPTPSSHPNHLWRLVPTRLGDDETYCYIRNLATNRALDHYYGRSIAGATGDAVDAPHHNHVWRLLAVEQAEG